LFNALNQTYDIKAVKYASPTLDSLVIQDNGISLTFKNAELGLYSYKTLNDFEIAGEDKVFYPAEAKIENRRTILVTSEKVTNPVAVRYGWRNYVDGTLFDASLLPVSSFRTDNWNDATIAEKQDKVEYPKK
jgi:sialate O-acetylesterase